MVFVNIFSKTIKKMELIKILIANKHLFKSGLCQYVGQLSLDGIITLNDYMFIKSKIEKYRYENGFEKCTYYLGAEGNWSVREAWIKNNLIEV